MSAPHWTQQIPGLDHLPANELALLQVNAKEMTVPAGSKIFETGHHAGAFLIVLDGCVRVQMVSESGREIVLYRVENGQTCILTTACLLSNDAYNAEAITENETTAVALPVQSFNALLGQSEAFRNMVFSNYGKRISNLVLRVEEVAFGRVDARLAQFLIDRQDDNALLKKTHYDLAVELGTAREVISRQLKDFEKKNWVALSRGQVQIKDQLALEGFISAQCD